jgi:hypothetical protein
MASPTSFEVWADDSNAENVAVAANASCAPRGSLPQLSLCLSELG